MELYAKPEKGLFRMIVNLDHDEYDYRSVLRQTFPPSCKMQSWHSTKKVPPEIWHEILQFPEVEDILMLEQTCHFFRDVISIRHFWLKRLELLDQPHAPDVPPHVSVTSLAYSDLRHLVIRARRRLLSRTGSLPLRITKEITIPVGQPHLRHILGVPFGWGADTLLVPGGQYFLMKWPAGYLQCWDVATKECLWTYPRLPQDTSDTRHVLTKGCFACDVQTNGDVRVAVVREVVGDERRTFEVLGFSGDGSLATIYRTELEELDTFHGLPVIIKLLRSIAVAYTEGYLMIMFWEENRTVVITDGIFDAIEILDEHIIGVTGAYDGSSLVAIPLQSIHNAAASHIPLADVLESHLRITPPDDWLFGRAQLSVCKFHWQEGIRDAVTITVVGDVYNEQNACDFPVTEFFSFGFEDSHGAAISGTCSTFTSLGGSKLSGFTPQFSTYSYLSPPSQAGSMVVALHDDRTGEARFTRILATFLPGRDIEFCVLDDSIIKETPATFSLNVELYSGALYYVTKDLKTVKINYFD